LHKTLEALAYCARNYAFDFCVRSNVSTVIDFARLPLGELDEGVQYASTYIWHGDAPFASGTNIFLSRAAVAYVLARSRTAPSSTCASSTTSRSARCCAA
jgi:hypothetical protein